MRKNKFQKMWEAHAMGVLWGEIVANNFSKKNLYKSSAELQEQNVLFYFDKSTGTQFYNRIDEMRASSDFGYVRFSNKKRFIEYLISSRSALRRGNALYLSFLKSNWQSLDDLKLWKEFKKQLDIFNLIYTHYHACQPQYFTKIENLIRSHLERKVQKDEIVDVFGALTASKDYDCIRTEELEWLKIVELAKSKKLEMPLTVGSVSKNKDFFEKLQTHIDKYISLGTVEANTPWDMKYYMGRLNKDITEDITKRIFQIKESKKAILKQKLEFIKQYRIDKNIVELSDAVAKIGTLRLDIRLGWTKLGYTTKNLILHEIGKRNIHVLVNENTIWDIKYDEIEKIITDKNVTILENDLENRKKSFLFNVVNGTTYFYSGDKAKLMKNKFIPEEIYDLTEFRGTIACKGKVRGKVIKFSWLEAELAKKMEEMERGDILVAGQTRPFLMPAIQKAGAIVTDEGGIMSHAAIVSRELNKPCIIGTKIATQVLKDGDMIEVDANTGVVKILK